mgnify:CR=1 FL=1
MEKGEFAGKTVIVTGSGAGLGRAISRAFAREGANVVVVDLDAEAGAPHLAFIPRLCPPPALTDALHVTC